MMEQLNQSENEKDIQILKYGDPSISMTVMGIYGRKLVPNIEEIWEKEMKDLTKDEVFMRRRLKTYVAPGESKPQEKAMFVPGIGLKGHGFYHTDWDEHDEDRQVLDERAILMQSTECYEQLMSDNNVGVLFKNPAESCEQSIELILESPRFGEQVIVKGGEPSQISIGDIFEVKNGISPLKVEVSSPRLPCSYVDKKSGSSFGSKGLKRHTMTHGLAGWFCRVLVAGELKDGMEFVRTSHPHPKWTLTFLSKALYGEGDKKSYNLSLPTWEREIELLRELCSLKQLGEYEWGWEANDILKEKEMELKKRYQAEHGLLYGSCRYQVKHGLLCGCHDEFVSIIGAFAFVSGFSALYSYFRQFYIR